MKRLLLFLSHWRNWAGPLLVMVMAGLAIAAPAISPQAEPENPQVFQRVGSPSDMLPRPPDDNALLGTLAGQYDVLFTLLWGLRQAFQFGLTVTLITGAFGVIYGAASGYLGGLANNVMMRVADALLAFPTLAAIVFMRQIIAILLEASGAIYLGGVPYFLGEGLAPMEQSSLQQFLLRFEPVMWALVLLSWMPYARLTNAIVLRLRNVDFVLSAQALGAGRVRVILRHILPNALSPSIVLAARDVGGMVVLQATYSFIGLGGNSPWSMLLASSRNWIVGPGGNPFTYWWTYLPVVLALILFSLGWNFIGDSLNEWLNPRKQLMPGGVGSSL